LTQDDAAPTPSEPITTRLCLRPRRLVSGLLRLMRPVLGLGLGLATLVVAAVAILAGALSRGPIAFDWLAPAIVESLDELYAPRFSFELKSLKLASSGRGPALLAEGLSVKTQGRVIVAAPRAELALDLPALLAGKFKPRRLELLDLELRFAVMPDGRVAVSAGAEPQNAVSFPDAPEESEAAPKLLARGGAALRGLVDLVTSPDSAIGALDRVGVAHGRLVIDDRALGRTITYDDLSLSLDKSESGMKFSLSASGAARRWALVAAATGAPGARRVFDARAQDFSIDDIALLGSLRHPPFDSDAPFAAEIHFALSESGRVVEASGKAQVGAGFFRLNEPDHEPVMIEQLSLAAAWDKAHRQFALRPIRVKTAGLDMTLEGEIAPPSAASAEPVASGDLWLASLRLSKPCVFQPERAGQKPLRIERAAMRSRLDLKQKTFSTERFEVTAPLLNAAGAFAIDFAPELHARVETTLDNSHLEAITRVLPTHVVAPVRNWLFEHVRGGVFRHATFKAAFTQAELFAMRYELPPSDESIDGEGDFENGGLVGVLPDLPPLKDISGHMRLSGRSFALENATAVLDTPKERRLSLSEGSFVIDDTAPKPAPAALDFRFAGGAEGVLEILALPALASYFSAPVDAALVKGQIDGRLHAHLEVGDGARADHTQTAIEASATGVSVDKFLGNERIDNGNLTIAHDRAGLRVTGNARLFGGPATIDIRRAADDKAATQAQLQVTLDDAQRAKAGLAIPNVSGPIAAQVKTALPVSEADAQVELDLTRASLDNLAPGLSKAAGKQAKANFTLVKRPDGMTLENFSLQAGPTQLAGVVELTRDGGFRAARLSQLRISPGDDLKLDAQRAGDVLKLTVRGTNLDARPILRTMLSGESEKGEPTAGKGVGVSLDDMDLDFKSQLATGAGKQILSNVEIKWERRGSKTKVFSLSGAFGREPLAAALEKDENGDPYLRISCGDAGSLFSFFDIYHRMEQGSLEAAVFLGEGRSSGELRLEDFFLKGEPAMRQLMTQGAHRADDKGALRFDPDSVRVQRLQTQFAWARGKLSLSSGIMSGPEMGLTFDGYVDFARDRVDVSGSYVPLYALNNLVGNIPLLGELIAGGKHEGVVAMNYGVVGPISSPTVNARPLSLLTPGLFRKVMGVLDGTARTPADAR